MRKTLAGLREQAQKNGLNLFDRYVLREFIAPYLGALLLIVFITNVTELLERMNFFLDRNISASSILLYYLYKSPFFLVQFSPVAALFAVVFSLGMLNRNRELVAMITQGVSFFRLVRVLYIAGIFLSVFFIFFNDLVVVRFQARAGEMNRAFRNMAHQRDKADLNMYGKENYVYHIRFYHFQEKRMTGIQVLNVQDNKEKVNFRIDAESARWDREKNIWIFSNGLIRTFNKDGNLLATEKFGQKDISLPERPGDFEYEEKDVDELTIRQSLAYIRSLKLKGFRYQNELVDFHLKFAFPFACLLMILIGAPLSLYSTKSVVIISFGLSLLVTFIYWVILSIGISMGKNGILPAFLAVWLGNILFSFVSYCIHRRVTT